MGHGLNRKRGPLDRKILATLTLVVEYENIDGIHDVADELLDKAREYGGVKQATLEILQPVKEELV